MSPTHCKLPFVMAISIALSMTACACRSQTATFLPRASTVMLSRDCQAFVYVKSPAGAWVEAKTLLPKGGYFVADPQLTPATKPTP